MSKEIDNNLEAMRRFIKNQKWLLIEAIFDYMGSCEGLFNLVDKLQEIDIILIYDKNNITDEFSLNFLYQIAHSEDVEIKEYRVDCDI